jgi:hypothetical protein
MSRSRLVSTIVLAGLALSPLPGLAQGTTQTHTVKKGDTLWDLAQQYLGPLPVAQIHRRNGDGRIPICLPGQVLVITGEVSASAGTPADTGAVSMPTAPVAGGVPAPSAGAPEQNYAAPSMTIFNPDRFKVVRGARETLVLRARSSTVRAGDFARAPFLWDAAGVSGAGRVGATVTAQGVANTRFERQIQVYERVYVKLPANAAGKPDEQYVSFRYGPTIEGEGRIIVPTGVFKLLTVPQNGQAEAVLLTKYEGVFEGHELIPQDAPDGTNASPARVEFGLRTSVLWLYDEPAVDRPARDPRGRRLGRCRRRRPDHAAGGRRARRERRPAPAERGRGAAGDARDHLGHERDPDRADRRRRPPGHGRPHHGEDALTVSFRRAPLLTS